MNRHIQTLILPYAIFLVNAISFAQTPTHPIAQKITHVRGAFQGDCHYVYVFDGFDATFDTLHHTFTFRVAGGYKGKYYGSYECIIPFAKVDSMVVSRIDEEDCLKEYLPKPVLYRVELRFKEEDVSLRSYGSPLPESFDQIYLYFFSAFEAYDFEKTIKRLKK
jgi:hypothetical protein